MKELRTHFKKYVISLEIAENYFWSLSMNWRTTDFQSVRHFMKLKSWNILKEDSIKTKGQGDVTEAFQKKRHIVF